MLACNFATGLRGVVVREVNRSLRAEDEKVRVAEVKALFASMVCTDTCVCIQVILSAADGV